MTSVSFFGPLQLLRGPCLHGAGEGGIPLFYALALGRMFLDLAPYFLNLYVFLDLAQDGRNLDIETRCMQEAADAGKVRILKQQKRKKW